MIKHILNPGNYHRNINIVLLILRVTVGFFMLSHGMGKFYKLIGDAPIQFADPLGIGASASLTLVPRELNNRHLMRSLFSSYFFAYRSGSYGYPPSARIV